ncbi:MAG: HAD-IIIA family hydrolase, partial [Bacteroidales bacterium]|nr:HAD-IIIA family hydrolase [Bacteroidales bacterium]
GKHGAFVDGIYICPHHPDKGFEGERPEYKCVCNCRKPKPGLLLQAAENFNIDLSQSIMIGDSESDVEAGKAAGCGRNILMDTSLSEVVKNKMVFKVL